MTDNNIRPSRHRQVALFVLTQVLFLAAVAGATGWRVTERQRLRAFPTPNEKPLCVAPKYDYSFVVSDEQLQTVLAKLRPALREPKPLIGHVDHALRFWGVDARFNDPQFVSGQELRDLLLNHKRFVQAWGKDSLPLIVASKNDVQIRTLEGKASASHVDHTLAALAEVGTPLTYPIQGPKSITSVKALLDHSVRTFSLNQVEYEWSTLIYALYFPHAKHWISNEGQDISFDTLADRIMRQAYAQGVCFGNHRIYTLTMLLRIDDTEHLLEATTRTRIISHLREATRRLVQNQHEYGYWDGDWASEKPLEKGRADQTLANKLLATGHALEWWAMAPEELLPPREVLTRAGQWLARTISEMDESDIKKNYTYLTHAGRSLAIWRGHEPAHFANLWWLSPSSKKTPETKDQESENKKESEVNRSNDKAALKRTEPKKSAADEVENADNTN